MRARWLGQSAFHLEGGDRSVLIDPFAAMEGLEARGMRFDYPPIEGVAPDLVLVTHEHVDHNGVEVAEGSPAVLRSTAGRLESPLGEVLAVASEHDAVAGTQRGPNTIFSFELDGLRVCHFGDFGQSDMRPEQAEALGRPDLLFVPVGDGPTIGGERAADIARRLGARWVVPMHYNTPALSFLEPADAFLDAFAGAVERLDASEFDTGALPGDGPLAVVPAPPS